MQAQQQPWEPTELQGLQEKHRLRDVRDIPCGWLTNVVTQKLGILAISSDLFWKNGWRSLLYFCSTFKISSLACSFSLQQRENQAFQTPQQECTGP